MEIRGSGPTLILVPGINGRWEWLRPAFDALAERFRVVTFSYRGEPGAPPLPAHGDNFDLFVQQVEDAVQASGAERVMLCGVSFGGWVALRYAARHPDRVAALVLASTPPPPPDVLLGWRYDHYVRHPWLFAPSFFCRALYRTIAEVRRTLPGRYRWIPFFLRHIGAIIRAPQSPRRSARRWRAAEQADLHGDCRQITAPTLIVTGEAELDGVVPARGTLSYLALIRGANAVTLSGTGHLGLITKPREFARIVSDLVSTEAGRSGLTSNDDSTSEEHGSLHRWPNRSPRGAR